MRRHFSIGCLLLAWLCANGALWNVVQVVAWARMYHNFSQLMPAARALEVTFDGSAPCELCHVAQAGQKAARDQSPKDADLAGGQEKLLLASENATAFVLNAPESDWPGVAHDAGLQRPELVPVPPPRA